MALTMHLADERMGRVEPVGPVSFASPSITVRDLLRARVELELERLRDQAKPAIPGAIEIALNGERGSAGPDVIFARGGESLEACVADAEAGFVAGRYFLLLGDRQAESLDEVIELDRTGEATFLLLTPLQGG